MTTLKERDNDCDEAGKLIGGPLFIANTDIVADSARWGMIIAVCATYPLCILWHLGARHLPQADQDGGL